jgi:hypothetical protein
MPPIITHRRKQLDAPPLVLLFQSENRPEYGPEKNRALDPQNRKLHRLGLIGFFFLSFSLNCQASHSSSLPTKAISGGEVSITAVNARVDGQQIVVSGFGLAAFPHRTCGHAEITCVNVNGEVVVRRTAEYDTSAWYHESPRKSVFQSRFVSFSISIPMSEAVASVLVRHKSTGGCEHSWSMQHVLDWLLDKIFFKGN